MQHLLNQMRVAAAQQQGSKATSRNGLVSGYDPSAYAVKVMIQPENTETGWVPLGSQYVGDGWGLVMGPSLGDAVTVDFNEGSFEAGRVTQRHFSDADRPPPCPSGEVHLIHSSGSVIRLLASGDVVIMAAGNINSTAATWIHTGDLNITGNFEITGNVTTGEGTVNIDILHHRHSDVTPGIGRTGEPIPEA